MTSPTTAFVLVDPPFRQSYRLLALLPFPAPILHQAIGILVSLSLAGLLAALGRNGSLSEFRFHIADVMSTITAGLGLGALSLAPSATPINKPRPSSSKPLRRAPPTRSPVGTHAAARLGALKPASTSPKRSTQTADAEAHHAGLRNTGNTCFFNSTVQSLASVPALRSHLDDVIHAAERWDVPTPVTDALVELIDALNAAQSRASSINPTALVNALRTMNSSPLRSLVSAHQQQDAHELFVLLSSAVDDEMLAISREAKDQQAQQEAGLRALIGASLPWNGKGVYSDPSLSHSRSHAESLAGQQHLPASFLPASPLRCRPEAAESIPQVSPFNALLAQRTICLDCGYMEAIRHFSSEEISLSLPPRHQATRTSQMTGTNACSLEECLAMWCELEPVEWICWHCSLVRTRDRAKVEVLRLEASVSSASAVSARASQANGHGVNGEAGSSALPLEGAKPSAAKKKRLREAKSRESRLAKVLSSGLSEDELAALDDDPSSPFFDILHGIKLDKHPSRMSTKQHMLSRPPRVLVFHLNRSTFNATSGWGGASKNDRTVLFPLLLDVSPFCVGGSLGTDGRQGMDLEAGSKTSMGKRYYRLCSITVHYGGHSFGHYVSFRRLPPFSSDLGQEERWVRISDETVRPCSVEDVLAQNPYMLFYELIDPSRLPTAAETTNESDGRVEQVEKDEMLRKREGKAVGYRAGVRPRIVHRWSSKPESREASVHL
ncbi:uncharacterized protein PFL1_02597 [Pseudozyma flocculosa PF-1]|uniref:Ubiquitin carboxyl-terminal hydrolase n=2 Tax=Pseudozyma flocculosa TaxID=84751 RepID=A0A5C3EY91_9BASI|nr:uncharacterized protein PFL1_02597 [Pseudozyma flocculosa PF-1]EPQ29925.1 hypothetical protein PFL1_02597 [Pseudozyma flocculosa PF-1]SPO37233.1 related to UBP1 - ubiquitin-specific protease [Pseudozyma flocculosa]